MRHLRFPCQLSSLMRWIHSYLAPLHLMVIQAIVLDDECPRILLQMSGRALIRLLFEPTIQPLMKIAGFDRNPVQRKVFSALGIRQAREFLQSDPSLLCTQFQAAVVGPAALKTTPGPKEFLVRFCTTTYAATAPPTLSHLQLYPPRQLLDFVYGALLSIARNGDPSRACRQIALSLITLPRNLTSKQPPLLPFLLNSFVPTTLGTVERLPSAEQAVHIRVLQTLIVWSLISSLRLERASIDVERARRDGEDEKPKEHSPPSATLIMAKALSRRLRTHRGTCGPTLHQRLLSTQMFTTNFQAFAQP